jgi:hypothetical protein
VLRVYRRTLYWGLCGFTNDVSCSPTVILNKRHPTICCQHEIFKYPTLTHVRILMIKRSFAKREAKAWQANFAKQAQSGRVWINTMRKVARLHQRFSSLLTNYQPKSRSPFTKTFTVWAQDNAGRTKSQKCGVRDNPVLGTSTQETGRPLWASLLKRISLTFHTKHRNQRSPIPLSLRSAGNNSKYSIPAARTKFHFLRRTAGVETFTEAQKMYKSSHPVRTMTYSDYSNWTECPRFESGGGGATPTE